MIKTGYIVCCIWGYVVYSVIYNRDNKNHMNYLRDAQERTDSGGRPYKISELVGRHGSEGWLEPLLDEVGPIAQTSISDAADILEMMVNFYSWRDPLATTQSLILWSSLAGFSALVSTEFGLKVMVFAVGLIFFVMRPITWRYPRFRKVISPTMWVYWDVPTNGKFLLLCHSRIPAYQLTFSAGLAFKGLQEDAQKARERMHNVNMQNVHQQTGQTHAGPRPIVAVSPAQLLQSDATNNRNTLDQPRQNSNVLPPAVITHPRTTHSETHNDDLLHFRGSCKSHLGRLVITPTRIRFTRTLPQQSLSTLTSDIPSAQNPANDLFDQPYLHLLELRKSNSSVANLFSRKEIISTDGLIIVWMDGTTVTIESMRKRDEAFNTIIGFSGLRFAVQQPLEGTLNGGRGGVTQGTGAEGRRTADDEKRERGILNYNVAGDGNTYGGARELGRGHGATGATVQYGAGRGEDGEEEGEGKMDKLKRKVDGVLHRRKKSGDGNGDGDGDEGEHHEYDADGHVREVEEVVYMDGEAVKGNPAKHLDGSVFKEISTL